jgi:hypothetical protein
MRFIVSALFLGCSFSPPAALVDSWGKASFVVLGTFANPHQLSRDGKADFEIESVIKSHEIVNDAKKLAVRPWRFTSPKEKVLLFCNVSNGEIDAFRAEPIADPSELLAYLSGALKLRKNPPAERLAYCIPFLNNRESVVSQDAYGALTDADYKHFREMARKLDPQMPIGRLDDPKTPVSHLGLYASLLGHCGKGTEHGDCLRKLFLNRDRHDGRGLDGMLEGYVMLQPKEGWMFLEKEIIRNPKCDFGTRYAGIRTLRFLYSQQPDLIDKKLIISAMLEATTIPDVGDFAIEDLRKWRCWQATDQILALAERKSHSIGVIQHAILRFAIQSPAPAAAAYVAVQRKRDPDQVSETEEILKLEPVTPVKVKSK